MVMRPSRYIWLGTNKAFEAFTFDFRRTDHGWFQTHIYRFDDHASTFICRRSRQNSMTRRMRAFVTRAESGIGRSIALALPRCFARDLADGPWFAHAVTKERSSIGNDKWE
jgi:hypothetical protein